LAAEIGDWLLSGRGLLQAAEIGDWLLSGRGLLQAAGSSVCFSGLPEKQISGIGGFDEDDAGHSE
jgi:hypothetical protein